MKLLNKIKNSAGLKVAAASLSAAAVTALGAISVCAADGETSKPDISGALSTAFHSMQSDVFNYIVIVLPIALAVVGAFFGIKKAISFFKSTASK